MIYPMVPFSSPWMTLYLDFKVTGLSQMPLTCAQLTRDLFAIAKFLFYCSFYKCRPVAIIFYADYTEFICNTIADLRASPTCCCYTTLGTSSTRQCASATCVTNDRALQRETSKFISPRRSCGLRNSADLNPVYHQIWRVMQDRVYETPVQDVADLIQLYWRL